MDDSDTRRERLLAGLEALQTGDFPEVISALQPVAAAAAAAGDHEAEIAARSALAQALMLAGRYPDALEHARRGLAVAEAQGISEALPQLRRLAELAGDEPAESQLVTELNARIQEIIPRVQAGDQSAVEALRAVAARAAAERLPGPEATARGLLGQALLHFDRRGEAEPELYRALALAEELGNDDAARHFRGLLAPEPDVPEAVLEAERQLQRAVETARQGRPQDALDLVRGVLDRARREDLGGLEASARGLMAQILLNVGLADEALNHAKLALRLAESSGATAAAEHFRELLQAAEAAAGLDASGPALSREIHSLVQRLQAGELEAAIGGLEAVIEAAVADEAPGPEATARGVLAQVMMRLSRLDEALVHARRALELAEEGGADDAAMQLRALVTQLENPPIGEA